MEAPNMEEEGVEYIIEHKVDKRILNGKIQYILKWKAYPTGGIMGEPLENSNCPDLILNEDNFEQYSLPTEEEKDDSEEVWIIESGLEPLEVLDATNVSGELMLLMKWKNSEHIDLVHAKEANIRCPHLVIQFYEKTIKSIIRSFGEPDQINNLEIPGFIDGLEPSKILGYLCTTDKITFLMKWRNSDEPHLVYASEANIHCPDIVISFYEENLEWAEEIITIDSEECP